MKSHFISLNEASSVANKSTQTIRRLIKANKIKFRRKRTPQGFIYFIDLESLNSLLTNNNRLSGITNYPSINKQQPSNDPIIYNNGKQFYPEPKQVENNPPNIPKTEYKAPDILEEDNEDIYILDEKLDEEDNSDFLDDIEETVSTPNNTFENKNNLSNNYINNPISEGTNIHHSKTNDVSKEAEFSFLIEQKNSLINQKDEIINHLVSQNQTTNEEKVREINKSHELINKLQDQINNLYRVMETLQSRLQHYDQKLLNPPKKWWQFWKGRN